MLLLCILGGVVLKLSLLSLDKQRWKNKSYVPFANLITVIEANAETKRMN